MSQAANISLPLLDRVTIASPCTARWEDMEGDDRTRHCSHCDLDVHNLASMTQREAEAFLGSYFERDGTSKRRLCARVYRRADGTVLTADCPVGLAALRAKAKRGAVRIAAALGVTAAIGWVAAQEQRQGRAGWAGCQPFSAVAALIGRVPQAPAIPLGGAIACPPPAPPGAVVESGQGDRP